jgi:hypothetical protein
MCDYNATHEFNKLVISGNKINPDSDWVGKLTTKHKVDVNTIIKTDVLPENNRLTKNLLPHQVKDVIAMAQLETKRGMVCNNTILYTRVGVLSEPFGSGKTFIVMGLVAYSPIPEQYKEIYYMPFEIHTDPIHHREDSICNRISRICPTSAGILVKRTARRIIKPTIVFCGTSVALQWANAIEKFSNFKYLLIVHVSGVIKLNKLLEDSDTSELDSYDFIIVKNGVITGVFDYKGYHEFRNKKKTRYIFNIISNITRNNNCIWSRLIIDDFDTINLPTNCGLVSSIFTWVVSGSKQPVKLSSISYHSGTTLTKVLDYSDYNFTSICHDRALWHTFNVSCSKKFTEECINLGIPKFYLYSFINKNDKTIKLIDSLGTHDIVEMLNGDAIETAAEAAGIKYTSVIDIFATILGKNHIEYKNAVELEIFINENLNFNELPSIEDSKSSDTYTKEDLYKKRPIKYNYPNLRNLLTTGLDNCKSVKQSSGIALQRVKDNINDGDCSTCNGELADEDAIITKCCGSIQCSMCGVQSSLSRQLCSSCRQGITLKDVVFINQNFDLTRILSDDIQYKTEGSHTRGSDLNKEKSKIDVLIDIINTQDTYPRKQVNLDIPNLLLGTKELPPPCYRSFIVFASYDETLKSIIQRFNEENISYRRLEGTAAQISSTVDEFNNTKFRVLLLRSAKDCAGLNLQSATDLVFIHKILNRDVEGQALGRIQRYGRKYSARIHYLLYKNEYFYFNFK